MKDRANEIATNCNYDAYKTASASMVYRFFEEKTGSGTIAASKAGVRVTKKVKRRKFYARFKDNIWAADLAELESSKNKNAKYLLCVIDVFTIYAWVKPLKDKKRKAVFNATIKIVNEYNRKPNKLGLIKEENFTINLCKNG